MLHLLNGAGHLFPLPRGLRAHPGQALAQPRPHGGQVLYLGDLFQVLLDAAQAGEGTAAAGGEHRHGLVEHGDHFLELRHLLLAPLAAAVAVFDEQGADSPDGILRPCRGRIGVQRGPRLARLFLEVGEAGMARREDILLDSLQKLYSQAPRGRRRVRRFIRRLRPRAGTAVEIFPY